MLTEITAIINVAIRDNPMWVGFLLGVLATVGVEVLIAICLFLSATKNDQPK